MNKYCKCLIGTVAALMLMSGSALACGGMSCSPGQCANKAGQAQGCAGGEQACAMRKMGCSQKMHAMNNAGGEKKCAMSKMGHTKKGHIRVPGKTSNYVRNILHKGELIGLSETQRKQINDLLANAEAATALARVQASVLIKAFYGKLRDGGVSDNEIKTYTERMGKLRAAHLQANLMASVHTAALLSVEQKDKLYGRKKSGAGKK
jgi:hypothetical protein